MSPDTAPAEKSPAPERMGHRVATGAAWMVTFKLLDRSLGVISTIVLARLLLPADFGLVAMAMSVIAGLELLRSFSFDIALIQSEDAGRDQYDSAFTLNVLAAVLLGGVLVGLAWPAAAYYEEPRLVPVMLWLAVGFTVEGFVNIGVVAFRKELQFSREFGFLLSRRISAFAVTMTVAVLLQSYWALVAGTVSSRVFNVGLSYLVHPYRPRFSMRSTGRLLHFSKWLFVNNILVFLTQRMPDFVIGKIAGARALGLFTVGYEISNLPTTELAAPMNRAIFPGYAHSAKTEGGLRRSYLEVIGVLSLFTIPAGVGIAATAEYLVPTVLGSEWLGVIGIVQVLAIFGTLSSIHTNSTYVFIALGRPDLLTRLYVLQTVIMVIGMAVFTPWLGPYGAAWAFLVVVSIMVPTNWTVLARFLKFRVRTILSSVFRPAVSSLVMWIVIGSLARVMPPRADLAGVGPTLALVSTGVVTYIVTLVAVWMVAGRPEAAETRAFEEISRRWASLRRKPRNPESPAAPRRKIGVVALVAHEWNAPWSTPHFTMTRLAHRFPVVWVDPTGQPSPGRGSPGAGCFRGDWTAHQFEVYRPERWLPAVHRHPWLARQFAKARMARAVAILRRMGCTEFLVYAWRPDFRYEFESRLFSRRCYHIDDEYTFESTDPPIPAAELHMLRASDAVFISSQLMFEKKGGVNPRTFLSPNGVDYDLYASPRDEPADLSGIPGPRIGYTGWMKRQLDWARIEALIGRNPGWHFVFVGPTSPHPEIRPVLERLGSRPNVHFLGRKTVDVLASYPQHFDVCIMPYVANGYTKYIDPLKLQEFLASGTPIVSTPLPSVKCYEDLVSFAVDVSQWESEIRAHLERRDSGDGGRAARQRMAREKDWARLAERIADIIEADVIGSRRPAGSN